MSKTKEWMLKVWSYLEKDVAFKEVIVVGEEVPAIVGVHQVIFFLMHCHCQEEATVVALTSYKSGLQSHCPGNSPWK